MIVNRSFFSKKDDILMVNIQTILKTYLNNMKLVQYFFDVVVVVNLNVD